MNAARIEICGGIASGKTTFANLVGHIGINPILENFQTNPFWEAFYNNPGKYIFETEISFMLQHYHQIKKENVANKMSICDYSFYLDIAYAEVGLKGSQLDAFMTVYEEIKREISTPGLLVYLICDARIELERIRKRARTVESSITLDFLDSINKAVDHQVKNVEDNVRVISINSAEKNFADDESTKQELIDQISYHITNLSLLRNDQERSGSGLIL